MENEIEDIEYYKRKVKRSDLCIYLNGDDDKHYRLKYTADPVFQLGQIYEDHAVFKLECDLCGSDKFQIGYHSHLTVSKCCKCGQESIVHDG